MHNSITYKSESLMSKSKTQLRWLWLSIAVIIIDQMSKFFVVKNFAILHRSVFLPIVNIMLIYNRGASFSLFATQPGWQRWFFILIAIVVSLFILYMLAREPLPDHWTAAGMALVLGGALGNLYDRMVLGYVVDFIDLHVGALHFPALFNLADLAINLGILCWVIGVLSHPSKK